MSLQFTEPPAYCLPPELGERLRQILNDVRTAPPSQKREAFRTAARRVVGEIVGQHYARAAAADRLQDTAEIHGITNEYGQEAIQLDLATAFDDPLLPDPEIIGAVDNSYALFDAEICRLAKLGTLPYERERKITAERFDLRTSVVDKLVAAKRGDSDDGRQGRALSLTEQALARARRRRAIARRIDAWSSLRQPSPPCG